FLRRFDGRPQRLGENISRRWTRPQPALNSENILLSHAELMMSSRHRFNILKADFIYVGVGIATNEMGDYWITQLFMTPRPTKESVMVIPPAEGH
ncbi:MAG: CAP domain-containing protein, partial [Candidatus Zipacnadales bacterium]